MAVAVPAVAGASDAGVREFLAQIEQHETGGNCLATPPTGSAIGCYQMTWRALVDVSLKNGPGPRDWVTNQFGVKSDEEFKRNRAANDYAVKAYVRLNWDEYLSCGTKRRICTEVGGVAIDEASLLAGAHFLGAGGMNTFVACGMHREECVPENAVEWNGGNRSRVHGNLLARMHEAVGLDISELTAGYRACVARDGRCDAAPAPPAEPTPPQPEPTPPQPEPTPSQPEPTPPQPEPTPTPSPAEPPPRPEPPPSESLVSNNILVLLLVASIALLGGTALVLGLRLARASSARQRWKGGHGGNAGPPVPMPAPPQHMLGALQPVNGSTPIPLPRALLSSREGLVIGRDGGLCHVEIRDSVVSRRHLRLRVTDGTIVVEDLNSLRGTQVDSVALKPFEPRPLTSRQTLGIAGMRYRMQRYTGTSVRS